MNLYENVTDPVEIARIMLTPRKYDELVTYAPSPVSVESLFAGLDKASADRLAGYARKALEEGDEELAENIAKTLATLTDFCLDEMLEAWVNRDHHCPGVAFRSAGPHIRDAILASLAHSDADANHALSALAWIGDETVQQAFLSWDTSKPEWSSQIYVSPAKYADVAGWELVHGQRRNLFHPESYALTGALDEGSADIRVKAFAITSQACPWCGQRLRHMLDIDLGDSRLAFLGFSHTRLSILTCHGCTCYRKFFAKVGGDGTARPHPKGAVPQWLPETSEPWEAPAWADVPVTLTPRRAIHAVDWCMELKSSQIGGLPCWVQDSDYPVCPDCGSTMPFIAQLSEDDFPDHEGTYYAFLCVPCRVTATCYQQT